MNNKSRRYIYSGVSYYEERTIIDEVCFMEYQYEDQEIRNRVEALMNIETNYQQRTFFSGIRVA